MRWDGEQRAPAPNQTIQNQTTPFCTSSKNEYWYLTTQPHVPPTGRYGEDKPSNAKVRVVTLAQADLHTFEGMVVGGFVPPLPFSLAACPCKAHHLHDQRLKTANVLHQCRDTRSSTRTGRASGTACIMLVSNSGFPAQSSSHHVPSPQFRRCFPPSHAAYAAPIHESTFRIAQGLELYERHGAGVSVLPFLRRKNTF